MNNGGQSQGMRDAKIYEDLDQNPEAEIAVLCSIFKHPDYFHAFDALSVDDFTFGDCPQTFAKMRELSQKGIHINPATVGYFTADDDYLAKHGYDWEEDWAGLIKALKELTFRRRMIDALTPIGKEAAQEEFDKAREKRAKLRGMSTPSLVLEFEKIAKEHKAKAEAAQAYIDEYAPALNKPDLLWETLPTEADVLDAQGPSIEYIVDEIAPKRRITMIYGQEKTGKSIIAWDVCRHVANGKTWLNHKVVKTPCLYIDAEDGLIGSYIAWTQGVGEEKVRILNLRSAIGIPALDDPGLLALCAEIQPLIVLDSLHKFFASNKQGKFGSAWQSSDYEPVLEKIRQLCVAGATVILIHHATKADGEQYRDSSAIGANVDFMFAVVADEVVNGIKRVHFRGQPSRGAQPPTIHILAFPHIIEHGHLCVDAGLEEEEDAAQRVAEEVEKHGPAENKTALAKRLKGKTTKKHDAINKAIELGWLKVSESGEINLGSRSLFGREFGREVIDSQPPGSAMGSGEENSAF